MTQPHIPAWLEDVVAQLVAQYEAEAVFLVDEPARSLAGRAANQRLIVLVDNEAAPGRGLAPRYRWERMEGFTGPVRYLRATLAEVMAGAYGGESPWSELVSVAHALYDPLDYQRRIAVQRNSMRTPSPRMAIETARRAAEEATQLSGQGGEAAAHLLALRTADELASWLARHEGQLALDASGVVRAVGEVAPGVGRAFAEVLQATGTASRLEALDRFIEAVDATLRLRDSRN